MFKLFNKNNGKSKVQAVTTHRVNFEKCEALTSDCKHITFKDLSVVTERTTEAVDNPCNEALIIQMEVQSTMRECTARCMLDSLIYNEDIVVDKVIQYLNSDVPFNSMGLKCTAITIGNIDY